MHLDIAYADDGDSFGMAMGHVPENTEIDGELRPIAVMDFVARLRPPPGRQIILSDIRQLIYYIRDDLGFNITKVTMDGFQSTDMMQQLQKKRFHVDYLSMDRKKIPYQDMRDAIYERRLEFPVYKNYLRHGDVELIEITIRELEQLVDNGTKVDHPPGGSKDIADSIAGVVYTLMGDRKYTRNVPSPTATPVELPGAGARRDVGSMLPGLPGNLPIPSSLLRSPPQLPKRLLS